MKPTELLAIYGAVLSTIVFIWNVRRAIPRIKVKIVSGSGEVKGEYESGIYISVQNPSSHTVHLSNISLLYPFRKTNLIEILLNSFKYRRLQMNEGWVHTILPNYEIDDGCPLALESGKSHNVFVPNSALNRIFEDSYQRRIKAVVQDQLWRNKYSRKFRHSL